MPIECCAAIYFAAEVILLCMSISSGEYTYIGMLGSAVLMHFCENIVQRKDRGLLASGSLYEKINSAAQDRNCDSFYGQLQHCKCTSVFIFGKSFCQCTQL